MGEQKPFKAMNHQEKSIYLYGDVKVGKILNGEIRYLKVRVYLLKRNLRNVVRDVIYWDGYTLFGYTDLQRQFALLEAIKFWTDEINRLEKGDL